jgi:hypothetical protein
LFPVVAPHVIATTPIDASKVAPVVNRATITFDLDMFAATPTEAASVTNPANYRLLNTNTGMAIPIGAVTYESASRTVGRL